MFYLVKYGKFAAVILRYSSIFTGFFVSICLNLNGQTAGDNCASPVSLCANNTIHMNNYNATTQVCSSCPEGSLTIGALCGEVNNTVWMSFVTNSTGGSATLSVSGVSCLIAAGMDNELELSVLSSPTPCTPPYAIANCTAAFSANQSISLGGLTPNTTYYIVIDGDDVGTGITAAAQCEFDISISGAAVDPDFNSTITNATCAGNDGQIVVNSVGGATPTLSYSIDGGASQSSNTFTGLNAGSHNVTVSSSNGCTYNSTINVPLAGGPQNGTPAITNATCGNSDGQIDINGVTGGTSPYNYSINGGAPQASNSFTGLTAGSYDITVTDITGCSFTYENVNVAVTGSVSSVAYNIVQPNCSTPTGTLTVIPFGGTTPYAYSLNGGAPVASSVFGGLTPGSYTVVVIDNSGCTYTTTFTINPVTANLIPQIIVSPSSVSVCQGSSVTFSASYSNGGTSPNVQWQVNGSNVGTNSPTFTTSSLNNGDVVVCILTGNDPCATTTTATSNSVTATIIPQITPTVSTGASSTNICTGELVLFNVATTGCSAGGTYYWIVNGTTVDSTTAPAFSYSFFNSSTVATSFSCDDPCSISVTSSNVNITVIPVFADAGPNQSIGVGESTVLNATATGSLTWSPSGSLNDASSATPVATPEVTTTYILTVVNGNCTATDEVTVVVTPLIVAPNTFTPNGDGTNDVWRIARIENFPSCQVTIYDRWGQKIFNSTGYTNNNPWDGTYLGVALPASTYYYVIELNGSTSSKSANTYYGWVSIIY